MNAAGHDDIHNRQILLLVVVDWPAVAVFELVVAGDMIQLEIFLFF